jgi:hypothetical protein
MYKGVESEKERGGKESKNSRKSANYSRKRRLLKTFFEIGKNGLNLTEFTIKTGRNRTKSNYKTT